MEIPLQAQVECTDGFCGISAFALINPVTERVTHLVVREDSTRTEYIVPLDLISETIAGSIQLRCSKAELETMDPFIKMSFIEEEMRSSYDIHQEYGMGSHYYWPYVSHTIRVPVDIQQIPMGELAVRRGTRVEATDGYVGRVDEFVVNSESGHITHLVMREGHLWGQKDVIIPLSALGDTREDTVFLKLDKSQVESLPTFAVHRRWS